ncbi:MAG: VWA domain-containing protein [Planctomycetaceae bacterium]|nr:VWA domain-containing protein [Planctomycetaceae bacterium]
MSFSRRLLRRSFATSAMIAAVERFEDRTLLSGNVEAFFNGTQLTLIGDAAANELDVHIGVNGAFTVTGANGTTVNGQMQFGASSSMLGSIVANLREGDDVLNIVGQGANTTRLGGLGWFQMGEGNDTFRVSDLSMWYGITALGHDGNDVLQVSNVGLGTSFFDGGGGNDAVELAQVNARLGVTVRGGAGDDQLSVDQSVVGRWLNLSGDNGADAFRVTGSQVGGHFGIWGGSQNDTVLVQDSNLKFQLTVVGDGGDDAVQVVNNDIRSFLLLTGDGGDDSITADMQRVGGDLLLFGGDGHDALRVTNSNSNFAFYFGGDGSDDLAVDQSVIRENLSVHLGNDHDLASLTNLQIGQMLYANAGWGNDGIGLSAVEVGGHLILKGDDGDDVIGLAGTLVHGEAFVYADLGDDAVVFSDTPTGVNTFEWNTFVYMGPGNDVVDMCGVHHFAHDLNLYGGYRGTDRILVEETQDVGGNVLISGFEQQNDTTVPQRVDELVGLLGQFFAGISDTPLGNLCGNGGLAGENPQVVLVVDVSGSTTNDFQGTPVGDINGDGFADTILDAELAAIIAFHEQFAAAGFGPGSTISVVVIGSAAATVDLDPVAPGIQAAISPGADADGSGTADFVEIVSTLTAGALGVGSSSTNFEAGLRETIDVYNSILMPGGIPNVVFLSDGFPNAGGTFDDEVATLQGIGANLIAFGIGQGASLTDLQIIDSNASLVQSTDEFIDALANLFTA